MTRGTTLEGSARWRKVRAAWDEAEQVASGERGDYPFDVRGKQRMLAALEEARAEAGRLALDGLMTEPEAALLAKELERLAAAVEAKRPTEAMHATCYKPLPISPAQASLDRLGARLPILERLAAAAVLQPEVVRKLLSAARADLEAVKKDGPSGDAGAQARTATLRSAEAALRRLEGKLAPGGAR